MAYVSVCISGCEGVTIVGKAMGHFSITPIIPASIDSSPVVVNVMAEPPIKSEDADVELPIDLSVTIRPTM